MFSHDDECALAHLSVFVLFLWGERERKRKRKRRRIDRHFQGRREKREEEKEKDRWENEGRKSFPVNHLSKQRSEEARNSMKVLTPCLHDSGTGTREEDRRREKDR